MEEHSNVIVVGVDGSPSARIALDWAVDEADRRRAALHIVQAYSAPIGYAGPGGMVPPGLYDVAQEYAETNLAEARDAALAAHPQLTVRTTARLSTPTAALKDASVHALMTVVGSHGAGVVTETILGSVALKVAIHSTAPVVVIRTDPRDPPVGVPLAGAPVMVGLDGSAESDAALGFAFEEASFRRVELIAVHTWDDGHLGSLLRAAPVEIDHHRIEQEEERLLAEQLAGWSDKYPEVRVRRLIRRGTPAGALIRTAAQEHPCLLVVGSRGRGGFTGLLLGSTSAELVAYASYPTAVVRRHRP